MNLKEERCSEGQISLKLGCSKSVPQTAVSNFIKLKIYWDDESKRRLRKTSTGDDSMLKLTVKRSSASSI